jgi:hypothetical protein
MADDLEEVERVARFLAVHSGCDPDTVVHLEMPEQVSTPLGVARIYHRSALIWHCYEGMARHIIRHKHELFATHEEKLIDAPQT